MRLGLQSSRSIQVDSRVPRLRTLTFVGRGAVVVAVDQHAFRHAESAGIALGPK
jgi:hypothetical protein